MLNSEDPRKDPCDTPNTSPCQGLYGKFTFVLFFLFVK